MYSNIYHCDPPAASPEPPELIEARVKVLAKHLAELLRENAQLRDEVGILKQRVTELEVTP